MKIEAEARKIADEMNARGLYPWHTRDFVKTKNLPITREEERRLVEAVRRLFELND